MAASIDDLIATVTAMSVTFTEVLAAINVQKSFIDNAATAASGSVGAAAASATAAATSATTAQTAAGQATSVVAGAADALAHAVTAADQALAALATIGTSLTAAQTAATDSAASATLAGQRATAAQTSANDAATSAASIGTAVADSAANALEAKGYRDTASDYAVAANGSAVEAQTAAEESQYWAGQSSTGQIQSDWTQTDAAQKDFIKNKPTFGTAAALSFPEFGDAADNQVVLGADSRMDDARDIKLTGTTTGQIIKWNNISFLWTVATTSNAGDYSVPVAGNAAPTQLVKGDDTRLGNARPIALTGTVTGQTIRWNGSAWAVSAYGTSAELNVATSGNASTTQVVKGDDTRLSNARAIALVGSVQGQVPRWDTASSSWVVSAYGTAANFDVATSGNASTTQVVKGNDTRLADSRPLLLAATTNGQVPTWNGVAWTASAPPGGLANFVESLNSSTPNATVMAARLLANGPTTHMDFIMSAKGDGALQAQLADGLTAGGNKRGVQAVDFQAYRTIASGVASGVRSVVVGGGMNTGAGNYSAVVGGLSNTSSGDYAFVGGGTANTAWGIGATVAGGAGNNVVGDYSCCPGGRGADTRSIIGAMVWAGAAPSVSGAQKSEYLLTSYTTSTTAVVATTDGLPPNQSADSNTVKMPLSAAVYVTIRILAKNLTDLTKVACWSGKALFVKGSTDASFLRTNGAITAEYATSGFAPAIPTITADTAGSYISVKTTGLASVNIQWVIHVETLEIVVA